MGNEGQGVQSIGTLIVPSSLERLLGVDPTGRVIILRTIHTPYINAYAAGMLHTDVEEDKEEFNGALMLHVVPGELFILRSTDKDGNDVRDAGFVPTTNAGLVTVSDKELKDLYEWAAGKEEQIFGNLVVNPIPADQAMLTIHQFKAVREQYQSVKDHYDEEAEEHGEVITTADEHLAVTQQIRELADQVAKDTNYAEAVEAQAQTQLPN